MRSLKLLVLLLLTAVPLMAQAPGEVWRDRSSGRLVRVVKVVEGRVYYVNLDTTSVLRTTFTRSYTEAPPTEPPKEEPPPPPADTVKPPPTDTVVIPPPPPLPTDPAFRIYAQHDFNDNTGGPFTNLASNPCGALCVNQRVEVLYERLDTVSSADRNRGIKWVPKTGLENTPFGATLYVAATFVIPSRSAAALAKVTAAANALGIPVQTDTAYERMQRKVFYGNPGRKNHFVLKIHALNLQFAPGIGGGAPCSTSPSPVPRTVYRFKDTELFDKPQRIEMEIRRSSGVRIADGEVRIWLNGVELPKQTGFCTNEDTGTSWQLQIGQQVSDLKRALWTEVRILDDVIVANKRPGS